MNEDKTAQVTNRKMDLRQKDCLNNTGTYSEYLFPMTSQSMISHRAERWAWRRRQAAAVAYIPKYSR